MSVLDKLGQSDQREFWDQRTISFFGGRGNCQGWKNGFSKKKPAPIIGLNWALGFIGFFAFLRVRLLSRILPR